MLVVLLLIFGFPRLAVVFVYVIYLFGPKNLWTKGVGFGLAVWVIIFGTLLGQATDLRSYEKKKF